MNDEVTAEHWDTVVANTGLIWMHLHQMKGLSEDERDDAFQDGLFGLLRAAQLFDPDLGWKFSTYASTWIRQAIHRGRGVRLGRNYRSAVRERAVYDRPLALDAPVTESGHGIGDLLEDPSVDPHGEVTHELVVEHLRRHCADDLDRALVERIDEGDSRFAGPLAVEHGYNRETGRHRMLRMRRLAGQLLNG